MEKKNSGKSIIWKTLTINKGFGEINNELPDIKTMQETNREHRKQQERKEINSEVSAVVQNRACMEIHHEFRAASSSVFFLGVWPIQLKGSVLCKCINKLLKQDSDKES